MIPKRQHMEQTTEGTISYLLSISWSHLSPTSAKPNSWLVEVMVDKVEATGSKGEKRVGGRDWGGLKEFLVSVGLTHGDVSKGGTEKKNDGKRGQQWEGMRKRKRELLLIVHFKYSALSADYTLSMLHISEKRNISAQPWVLLQIKCNSATIIHLAVQYKVRPVAGAMQHTHIFKLLPWNKTTEWICINLHSVGNLRHK